MAFSEKQYEILDAWRENKLRRINILQGAVRSGKTFISCIIWVFFVASAPNDATFLMAARTLNTLERNILHIIRRLAGQHFTYSLHKKEATLFGKTVYLEGAGDKAAEEKIRGMTLYGAYVDELTLIPESFFNMLLSRLSLKDAKLFATTNPDSPNHWLYRNYLSRTDLDLYNINFSISDNPFLDYQYVRELKKEYKGVFYERYIEGKWVVAEGLVYPMFSYEKHVKIREVPTTGQFYISVDYGTLNPCSMGIWHVQGMGAYRFNEFYHSGKENNRLMTDEEYYAELEKLAGTYPIQYIIVDPSAASFIEVIKRHGRFSVKKADNTVMDGIRRVQAYLSNYRLTFSPLCKNTIREFSEYAFDETAPQDKVIKESDHAMDDIRYFVNTVLRR